MSDTGIRYFKYKWYNMNKCLRLDVTSMYFVRVEFRPHLDVLLSLACVLSAKSGGEKKRVKKKREKGKREGVFGGEGGESSLSSPPLPFNSHPFLRVVTVFAQENCCKSGMKSQKLSTSEQPFSCRVLRVI